MEKGEDAQTLSAEIFSNCETFWIYMKISIQLLNIWHIYSL